MECSTSAGNTSYQTVMGNAWVASNAADSRYVLKMPHCGKPKPSTPSLSIRWRMGQVHLRIAHTVIKVTEMTVVPLSAAARARDQAQLDPATRARIEQAVLDVFADREFHRVGLIEIARAANVSLQTIYKYYG